MAKFGQCQLKDKIFILRFLLFYINTALQICNHNYNLALYSVRVNMKSLLELITCYGSSSTESESRQPAEEFRSLVATRDRRCVGRKRGKVMGTSDWSPSLLSISENNKLGETNNQPRPPVVRFNRNLMRKVGSVANKDQDPSSHHDDTRSKLLI